MILTILVMTTMMMMMMVMSKTNINTMNNSSLRFVSRHVYMYVAYLSLLHAIKSFPDSYIYTCLLYTDIYRYIHILYIYIHIYISRKDTSAHVSQADVRRQNRAHNHNIRPLPDTSNTHATENIRTIVSPGAPNLPAPRQQHEQPSNSHASSSRTRFCTAATAP